MRIVVPSADKQTLLEYLRNAVHHVDHDDKCDRVTLACPPLGTDLIELAKRLYPSRLKFRSSVGISVVVMPRGESRPVKQAERELGNQISSFVTGTAKKFLADGSSYALPSPRGVWNKEVIPDGSIMVRPD
jgi:hypothetical protein